VLQIVGIAGAEAGESFNPFFPAATFSHHVFLVDASFFNDRGTPFLFSRPLNAVIAFFIYPPLSGFLFFSSNAAYGSIR